MPRVATLSCLALVAALTAACGPEVPATGPDTDAGPDVAQAPACAAYVACQDAIAAEQGTEPPASLDAYREGGDCWLGEAEADACAATCADEVETLGQQYPDLC